MTTHWETIHEENRNGLTSRLAFTPEFDSPRDSFDLPEDDMATLLDDIESGRLLWFAAAVTAYGAEGEELASDYLGACCYESAEDFIRNSGYYDDMVATVEDEAHKQMARRADNYRAALAKLESY